MRTTYTILTLVACPATGFAQANMSIIEEAKADATFLSNRMSVSDCYSLVVGDKAFAGEASTLTKSELVQLLGQRMTIKSGEGCAEGAKITSVSLEISYADGRNMQYPDTAMPNLTENPAVAERLLYDATSVKFVGIKVEDQSGAEVALADHTVTLSN